MSNKTKHSRPSYQKYFGLLQFDCFVSIAQCARSHYTSGFILDFNFLTASTNVSEAFLAYLFFVRLDPFTLRFPHLLSQVLTQTRLALSFFNSSS